MNLKYAIIGGANSTASDLQFCIPKNSATYNSPCTASSTGQTNQRGLGLSGSIHEEAQHQEMQQ